MGIFAASVVHHNKPTLYCNGVCLGHSIRILSSAVSECVRAELYTAVIRSFYTMSLLRFGFSISLLWFKGLFIGYCFRFLKLLHQSVCYISFILLVG